MINTLNGEYRSITAKYGYLFGIMVISWSPATVHNTLYGRFEHTHVLVNMYTGLGKVSFTFNDQYIEY